MSRTSPAPLVAIACGGTGGHFFPGLAVGEALQAQGCEVLLLVSTKAIDQHAAQHASGLAVATLPAVGLESGGGLRFLRGFWDSYRAARRLFRSRRPRAILAMGGFTSAPPVLAARAGGVPAFLHEANSLPGRANRWLAHVVQEAFVYFPEAAGRLWQQRIQVTGMPVRAQFQPLDPGACRVALGLHPERPTLVITGGSQGAHAVNELVLHLLPALRLLEPDLQFIHLTGPQDLERVREGYAALQCKAVVRPFLTEMELALGAATAAVTRAGASSLAELAAMRLPAVLIPYPAAADNHQFYNARALAETGAARVIEQARATAEALLWELRQLLRDAACRQGVQRALAQWHCPEAATRIAAGILAAPPSRAPAAAPTPLPAPTPNEPLHATDHATGEACRS